MSAIAARRGVTTPRLFLALVVVQAAHSVEEFVFRLYEVFPPARFASGLVPLADPPVGFAVLNAAFVAFGLWCYVARVRPGHPSAAAWIAPWVVIELGNGVGHPAIAILRGAYFPGAATAPLLLVLAGLLAGRLLSKPSAPGRAV